jgi:hypothetical protein
MQIVADLEDICSSLFLKGVTYPKVIKKGDISEIGKSLQRISEFFDNRIEDLEFQPQKEEIDKTLFRLKRTNKVIWKMGKEIEMMKTSEPRDYHWYIIGVLIMNLISLFNHIEIHMEYH